MWVQVPSPAYDKKRTGTRTCPFLVTSRSHLNPGFKVSGLLCKPSVRRNHRLRPIRLKTAHRAVFFTPNAHLPRAEKRREPLAPRVQGLRLASKASVRGKLRLRHAALSGCYRIRRCRGFAVYIRFDFHSFASKLALGKSKRMCMAHWTRNLPQHKSVMH